MKLVTFEVHTPVGRFRRLGALDATGNIVDLNFAHVRKLADSGDPAPGVLAAATLPADMLAFLQGGTRAMVAAGETLAYVAAHPGLEGNNGETLIYSPDTVRLLAPLPKPASLRDFYAFEGHARYGYARRGEPMPDSWFKMPVYYKGNTNTIIGSDSDVLWPSYTRRFDYETEMGMVIGRQGRDISEVDAPAYIAGYTVLNDFSARDIQRDEMACRLGPAKAKDFATALGPCLVTPDEMPAWDEVRMIARVNGEVWSDSNYGTIHWSWAQMIAHVSQSETVYPGDVFGSGTMSGGCGFELDRWLQPGDVVELEISGIGILRNRVVAEAV